MRALSVVSLLVQSCVSSVCTQLSSTRRPQHQQSGGWHQRSTSSSGTTLCASPTDAHPSERKQPSDIQASLSFVSPFVKIPFKRIRYDQLSQNPECNYIDRVGAGGAEEEKVFTSSGICQIIQMSLRNLGMFWVVLCEMWTHEV